MNKYQEALGFLKENACENYFRQYVQTCEKRVTISKSSKYLQELVDKATPKKLKGWTVGRLSNNRGIEFNCPTCDTVHHNKFNFCPNCGQAIDWGTGNNV